MPLMRSLAILTAAVVGLVSAQARADDATKTVTATGEAAVLNGDEATAKTAATKAALRAAVEQTLGTFIVSDSQTKDFQLVKDQVLSTSAGYVSHFDVLDTKKDGDAYVVTVKADVRAGQINADAAARGLTIRLMNYPRMAALIAEQNVGQTAPTIGIGQQGGGATMMVDQRIVENQIVDAWTAHGFRFLDLDALAGQLTAARVVTNNPSADDLRKIKNIADADVFLTGQAIATSQGDVNKMLGADASATPMYSCKASVSLRALNGDGGEILATTEQSATKTHIQEISCGRIALQAATKLAENDLESKLLESWKKRQMGGSSVRMKVTGVDFKTKNKLKELLATIRGVQNVAEKHFADNAVDLDINLEGGAVDVFASDIDGKKVSGSTVKVTATGSNTISIELAK
jgi:hypothetical protein